MRPGDVSFAALTGSGAAGGCDLPVTRRHGTRRNRTMPEILSRRALAILALWLLASAFTTMQDAKGRVTIHNGCRVYYPSVIKCQGTYKKVGVVTSRKVFEATSEYKQIARRRLTPNTAEWCFLAKAASDKFRAAIDKAVK